MAEVQGGRTLRPAERKARHNKVYTAKGPRDRRVRLSADTAIQFYDVQDRLGYERASEAVDWLIKKAKGSIDKLFNTSSSQNSELLTRPGAQNSAHVDYLGERSMFEKEELNLAQDSVHVSEYNAMESSFLFPYLHAGNCPSEMASTEGPGNSDQVQRSGLSSDDEIVKFYITGQGHGDQEQNMVFNQPAFLMPASYHE